MKNLKFFINQFDRLFPITRSITGDGYRKSIKIIQENIPLKIFKFKSGVKIFDWRVPKEWVIKDAFISVKNKKIVDFNKNNLHVVNYSSPINKNLNYKKLVKKIHYIKKTPNAIPYVTSYYKKDWGFCISYNKFKKIDKKAKFKAVIQSKFKNGNLEIGLAKLKGKSNKIFLISTYLCHPSMANNELSGPIVLQNLYNKIKKWKNRNLTYYFLINPETIGSIAFIKKFKNQLNKQLHSGVVLTCLGGPKKTISYKVSKNLVSPLDKIISYYSKRKNIKIRNFDPMDGSDERQYCSGNLNYPIGQFARTIYGKYKEYHTSADNKKFINFKNVIQSSNDIEKILKINDATKMICRNIPECELQLGKRGLYPNKNFHHSKKYKKLFFNINTKIMMAILSYADGKHNIYDIHFKTSEKVKDIKKVMNILIKKKLIYLSI